MLEYDKVIDAFYDMMEWLAGVYVNTLNVIHYMHDKYCYERAQMALHDRDVRRYFATGIAGTFRGRGFPFRHQICEGGADP